MRTLLLGLSTRALAESAVRSGRKVFSLDYFGDWDQKTLLENHSLARDFRLPFSAENLLTASEDLTFNAVVYTSNLENHTKVVDALGGRAEVLGNGPEVLGRVRDCAVLRAFCRERSIPFPHTLLPGEEKWATSEFNWLCKPARAGGGSGIRPWDGRRLKHTSILQVCLEGLPASAAFVADGKRAVVIGMTRQLIGHSEFGAFDFSWCGNILPLFLEHPQRHSVLGEVERMATLLVRHFGLRGVGGIDFVVSTGPGGRLQPFLVEVNPRYTASMELIERAYGLNMYSLHLESMNGHLPAFSLAEHLDGPFWGKGIVFARKSLLIRDTEGWAERGWRDIPFPGDRIPQSRPICTVFSSGDTHHNCLTNLLLNAASVRRETNDLRDVNEEPIYTNHRADQGAGPRPA